MRGWKTKVCELEEGFPTDELIRKQCPMFDTRRKESWEEKIGIYLHYDYNKDAYYYEAGSLDEYAPATEKEFQAQIHLMTQAIKEEGDPETEEKIRLFSMVSRIIPWDSYEASEELQVAVDALLVESDYRKEGRGFRVKTESDGLHFWVSDQRLWPACRDFPELEMTRSRYKEEVTAWEDHYGVTVRGSYYYGASLTSYTPVTEEQFQTELAKLKDLEDDEDRMEEMSVFSFLNILLPWERYHASLELQKTLNEFLELSDYWSMGKGIRAVPEKDGIRLWTYESEKK